MQPLLLDRLVADLQERLSLPRSSTPNTNTDTDPILLHNYLSHLISEENKISTFTPDALIRLANGLTFGTYSERDRLGLVRLNTIGGLEEGSTALAAHGVFELANIVARYVGGELGPGQEEEEEEEEEEGEEQGDRGKKQKRFRQGEEADLGIPQRLIRAFWISLQGRWERTRSIRSVERTLLPPSFPPPQPFAHLASFQHLKPVTQLSMA